MADLHVWRVALRLEADAGTTPEQALERIKQEEDDTKATINKLQGEISKAMAEVEALKKNRPGGG